MVLEETKDIPSIHTDCTLQQFNNQFPLQTATTFIIQNGNSNNNNSESLILPKLLYAIDHLPLLEQFAINVAISNKAVKKTCKTLINSSSRRMVYLFVKSYNLKQFHRYLDKASMNNEHNIAIYLIQYGESTSNSSSESELEFDNGTTGIKRNLGLYETPPEVKRHLKKTKYALMKLYIQSGQARLRSSEIPIAKFLKNIRIVDMDHEYEDFKNYRPLNDACLY